MYPPPHYSDNSPAFLADVMRQHSFALMTMAGPNGLLAVHLPFVLKDEGEFGTLYGHISKNNPQAALLNKPTDTMVVFTGPHAYISASWYNEPARRVPTWNYISVQAKGYPVLLPKESYMNEMALLTSKYETDDGWAISKAADYAEKIIAGIVYFKIPLSSLSGIRKMSVNKNKTENENVIKHLQAKGETETAKAMKLAIADVL